MAVGYVTVNLLIITSHSHITAVSKVSTWFLHVATSKDLINRPLAISQANLLPHLDFVFHLELTYQHRLTLRFLIVAFHFRSNAFSVLYLRLISVYLTSLVFGRLLSWSHLFLKPSMNVWKVGLDDLQEVNTILINGSSEASITLLITLKCWDQELVGLPASGIIVIWSWYHHFHQPDWRCFRICCR